MTKERHTEGQRVSFLRSHAQGIPPGGPPPPHQGIKDGALESMKSSWLVSSWVTSTMYLRQTSAKQLHAVCIYLFVIINLELDWYFPF